MTLHYVFDRPAVVAAGVASLIPHCDPRGFPAHTKAIGIVDGSGRMIAGILYYHHNPASKTVEMAAAALPGKNWLTRATIRLAFTYAFGRLGCQMVMMRVRADNPELWKRLAGFGFELSYVRRLYGRDTGGMICTLTDDAWEKNRFYPKPLVPFCRPEAA